MRQKRSVQRSLYAPLLGFFAFNATMCAPRQNLVHAAVLRQPFVEFGQLCAHLRVELGVRVREVNDRSTPLALNEYRLSDRLSDLNMQRARWDANDQVDRT